MHAAPTFLAAFRAYCGPRDVTVAKQREPLSLLRLACPNPSDFADTGEKKRLATAAAPSQFARDTNHEEKSNSCDGDGLAL